MTGAAIRQHIVAANPGMRVVAHSWAFDQRDAFLRAFRPAVYAFEDNRALEAGMRRWAEGTSNDWTQLSRAYSFMKAAQRNSHRSRVAGRRANSRGVIENIISE